MISNKLIVNCTLLSNETNNDCRFYLTNGEVWLDIEAYDVDNESLSSTVQIRFYRDNLSINNLVSIENNRLSYEHKIIQWLSDGIVLIIIACLIGLLFVIAIILVCIFYLPTSKSKPSSLMTNVTDDNSTKQKIIQTSSSSEQSSSAGSLYGSEKSENITVETSVCF